MFTIFVLCLRPYLVHFLFASCSPLVHCFFTSCSLPVRFLLTCGHCLLSAVHALFSLCPLCSTCCSLHVHSCSLVFIVCSVLFACPCIFGFHSRVLGHFKMRPESRRSRRDIQTRSTLTLVSYGSPCRFQTAGVLRVVMMFEVV